MNVQQCYGDLVSQLPTPAAADMPALWERAARGDRAAIELIAHQYLPFVISRARRAAAGRWKSLDFMDLVQEGNIGLLRAIERFDETKGADITTYACYWIDAKIRRFAREQNQTITVKASGWDNLSRLRHAEKDLRNEGDTHPSFDAIVRKSGLTPPEVRTAVAAQRAIQETIRLDQRVFDDDETTLMEVIPDPGVERVPLEAAAEREEVRRALAAIGQREAGVLRMRFGFCSDEPMTLDQIASVMSISRERVRQLEVRALAQLRVTLERVRLGMPVRAPRKRNSLGSRIRDLARRGLSAGRIAFALRKDGRNLSTTDVRNVLAVPA